MYTVNKLNYYAIWLHGLSFAGVLTAFLLKPEEANFNTDLFRMKLTGLTDGDREVTIGVDKQSDIPTSMLKAFILIMFGVTALFHAFYYTDGFGTGAYRSQLAIGRNVFRWIEYAITSTAMIFVLSIISGVKSADSVLLICAANIVLMSLGYFIEITPNRKSKIVGLVAGFFLLSAIWAVILTNFYKRISEIENIPNADGSGTRSVPGWVKQVIVPMFIWYISFGVIASLYVKNVYKPGYRFETYERYYILLSYLSKAFMGYYLTFGLTRDKAEDL